MGDKLNQKNNSADNNLGHFFKATDIDDKAMKVKIITRDVTELTLWLTYQPVEEVGGPIYRYTL